MDKPKTEMEWYERRSKKWRQDAKEWDKRRIAIEAMVGCKAFANLGKSRLPLVEERIHDVVDEYLIQFYPEQLQSNKLEWWYKNVQEYVKVALNLEECKNWKQIKNIIKIEWLGILIDMEKEWKRVPLKVKRRKNELLKEIANKNSTFKSLELEEQKKKLRDWRKMSLNELLTLADHKDEIRTDPEAEERKVLAEIEHLKIMKELLGKKAIVMVNIEPLNDKVKIKY